MVRHEPLGPLTAVLILTSVCWTIRVQAEGPAAPTNLLTRPLTLQDAVALAVQQNPTLAGSTQDLRIAEAHVLEAAGVDDFLLEANSSWLSSRAEVVLGQSGPYDSLSLSTALTRPLPTGGSVGLRFGTDPGNALGSTSSQAGAPWVYTPSLQLTFSHPVLRGAGVAIARAGRRRASAARDIATLQREQALSTLLRDVSLAYWELAYSTAELQIRASSVELAREQLRAVEANIGVGKQPPSASAEVEVAVALRQEEELLAQQTVREHSVELRRLLGLEIDPGQPVLIAVDQAQPTIREPNARGAIDEAMAHNPELAATRAQGRAASIDVEVTDNGLLPQLDVSFGGGPIGNAEDATRAFGQLAGFDGFIAQVGMVFSQPLGRRAARGQAGAAREALRKARVSETDVRAQIQAGVMKAVDLVNTATRRLEALSKVTDLADLDLSAEKARFEVGRSTNFDVLRRQDELAQAKLRQARARIDYLRSFALLDSLTAENLAHHGLGIR
jgi:outer membrane protein TolC